MGSIRIIKKKNGEVSFHAAVRLKGFIKRQTWRTKSLAKDWIQKTEAAIKDGRYNNISATDRHTVGDLIDRFIAEYLPKNPKYSDKNIQLLRRWKEELGDLYLKELSAAHICQIRDKLLNENTIKKKMRTPSTVNRYLAAFSKPLALSEVSITEIQRLAERGLPMAQCLLGLSYKLGDYELVKDEVKGVYWITKAAAQGYVPTQECLTGYYRDEKTDYKKSWHWALEAAQRGSGETMRILAIYAIQGQGCDKDLCECIKWLLLSASAGDQASQEWLSELDYKVNIYEASEFYDGYNLAQKWLEIYKPKSLKINQKYTDRFEHFVGNEL